MNSDDKINFAVLVAVLIFAALAFPALYDMERDAEIGAAARQLHAVKP